MLFAFLIIFSLTFEEEKILKFLDSYMTQFKGEIKLEKKHKGENYSIYYAVKKSDEKGKTEFLTCALISENELILGEYFLISKEENFVPTPEKISNFLKNVMLTSVKVQKEKEIKNNIILYKIFQETGYGKVNMNGFLIDKKHFLIGNLFNINEKIEEWRENKIKWEMAGKIGDFHAKEKIALFFDLECPHCAKFEKEIFPVLKEKKEIFAGFFLYPLSIHNLSFRASAAAFCFKKIKEEYFFDFINWYYEERKNIELENIDLKVYQFAEEKNLQNEFISCYMKPENLKTVLDSLQMGIDLDIKFTPAIFLNGKAYLPKDIIEILKEKK